MFTIALFFLLSLFLYSFMEPVMTVDKQPAGGDSQDTGNDDVLDLGDVEPRTKKVRYMGRRMVLREASGAAATKYHAAEFAGRRIIENEDGGVTVQLLPEMAEVEPRLVAACLYYGKIEPNGTSWSLPTKEVNGETVPDDSQLVKLEVVNSWPESIRRELFKWIKDHSALDEGPEDLEVLKKKRAKLDKRIAKLESGKDTAAAKNS